MKRLTFLLLGALLLAGCAQPAGVSPRAIRGSPSEPFPASSGGRNMAGKAVHTSIVPPELSAVLQGGPGVAVEPIEVNQLQAWQAQAELRLRLGIQQGKCEYLRQLLQLAEQSEEKFLQQFDIRSPAAGQSAADQVRVYGLIRNRIEAELKAGTEAVAELQACVKNRSIVTTTLSRRRPERVVSAMTEPSLTKLGLTSGQCAVLAGLGVTSNRDLAMQFYLQPAQLADLLSIAPQDAERMVAEAARSIPKAELALLVHEARIPRSFGVLPPPGGQQP